MDANAVIRQIIAEILLVFDIGLGIFIARYLWCEYRKRGLKEMRERVANQAAIAVGMHIIGLGIIRTWSVVQFVIVKHGGNPGPVENEFQFPLIGLILAVAGMSCCIRVFAPVKWKHWGWLLIFMAALAFVGYMQSYV